MPKKIVEFSCVRCGHCCKTIRGPMMGQLHGLMLLPNERELFRKKLIKPMFRYMERYYPLPGMVFMYQVDAEYCPYYDEGEGCLIYDERPQTCRGFPFEPKGEGVTIHSSCPEVQRLLEEGATSVRFPRSYLPALVAIQRYYNKWLRTNLIERFDLEEQKWNYMTDGITREHKKAFGWK